MRVAGVYMLSDVCMLSVNFRKLRVVFVFTQSNILVSIYEQYLSTSISPRSHDTTYIGIRIDTT